VGLIGNDGIVLAEEVGKFCVRREKGLTVVLEHHYLEASQGVDGEHITYWS